ncbi:polysaccharide deacetylase family protein [bacterium]|nr:polysaccharide deacetylase family protein [bacterium]
MKIHRNMFILLFLTKSFLITYFFPHMAFGAILSPAPIKVASHVAMISGQSRQLIPTHSFEAPTESGNLVFYNRQLIAQTLGKNRQILLTFDDGPNPRTTPIVLEILKRRNIKGIFFLVGTNVRKYPEIARKIHSEGHTIGNHSYYHPNLTYLGVDRISREIRDTNALIKEVVGVKPTLFRPPYGALNNTVLNCIKHEGLSIMLWSVDPGDWRNKSMSRTVENLKAQLNLSHGGKGGIVLLHDTLPSTVHALEPFLIALTQHGILPSPFGTPASQNNRSYWAMKDPAMLFWHQNRLNFKVEEFKRPLLTAIVNPSKNTSLPAIKLLRARKTGNLTSFLLSQM